MAFEDLKEGIIQIFPGFMKFLLILAGFNYKNKNL
jgi:hypothetical protein